MNEEEKMAANAEDIEKTITSNVVDADDEKVNFTDGEPQNEKSDEVNKSKVKDTTKAFSERLKKEKERMEQEFSRKKQEDLDNIAKQRGFKDWNELDVYNQKDRLEAMGIQNPTDFNSYVQEVVSKSPIIEEAKKILEAQKQKEQQQMVEQAIGEISKIDPDIQSLDDLVKLENYDDFYSLIEKGYSMSDAYKVVAFDKITSRKIEGAKQEAITNIDSKNHFKPLAGSKAKDVIVPDDIMATYHKNMPGMTTEQIKEHYSKYVGGNK